MLYNMLVDLGESLLFNNSMHNDIGFYHEFIMQLYACQRELLSLAHLQFSGTECVSICECY